jgi:flavoprotein
MAALSTPAWAMGTLAISSVAKISTATGDNLIVTATCVKDEGKVKIWVSETTTLVQTKISPRAKIVEKWLRPAARQCRFQLTTLPLAHTM